MLSGCGEREDGFNTNRHSQRGRWERGMHSQRGRWERGKVSL